jgi:hypothetical protein
MVRQLTANEHEIFVHSQDLRNNYIAVKRSSKEIVYYIVGTLTLV